MVRYLPVILKYIIISSKSLPIIPRYCPPLRSNQILSSILDSKERKKTAEQLERFYPGQYSLGPLNDTIKEIKRLNKEEQKVHLVGFLINFARYYRDLKNYERMGHLINRVNILGDDKLVELSHQGPATELSRREIEVLELIARGTGNKLIADRLSISESTVKTHIQSIFQKLEVNDRTEAVTKALSKGIIRL